MTLTHVLNPATVQEIVENAFQPDGLAAHEYFDTQRRKTHLEPEKDLMLAILADAVRCYRTYAFSRASSSKRLYRDAEKWLWSNEEKWPFSCRNICEVLGLEPFFLRRGLLHWQEAHNEADPNAKPRVYNSRRRAA